MADALAVALALGLIMAFTACALARILLHDAAGRAERAAEALRASMYGYSPERVTTRPRSSIWTPAERRAREPEGSLPGMDTSWADASTEERAAAVLAVLPTHYEDSNGITAMDVAHRIGIKDARPAGRVSPLLRMLAADGKVLVRWDKSNRRRRTYWRTQQ